MADIGYMEYIKVTKCRARCFGFILSRHHGVHVVILFGIFWYESDGTATQTHTQTVTF